MHDDNLLEFGPIDVYYVVWPRCGKTFYLSDMTPDLTQVVWSANRSNGLYFYTENDAHKLRRQLNPSRPDIRCEAGEIDIVSEIEGFF